METRYQKRMRIKNNKSFQIFVKTLNGKTIVVDSREQTTLLELKKIIGKRNGLASQNIVLRGGIHMLDDFKSLEENKIANNSTLHMTLRLKGGMEDTAVVSSSPPPPPTGASGANPGPPIGPRPPPRPQFGNISSSGDEADVLAAPREEPRGEQLEQVTVDVQKQSQDHVENEQDRPKEEAEAQEVTVDVEQQSQQNVEEERRRRQEESDKQELEKINEAIKMRKKEKAAQIFEAEKRAAAEAAAEAAAQEERAAKKREKEEKQNHEKLQTVKKEKHEMSTRDLKIRQLEFDYYNNYNPKDIALEPDVKVKIQEFNEIYNSIKASVVKKAHETV